MRFRTYLTLFQSASCGIARSEQAEPLNFAYNHAPGTLNKNSILQSQLQNMLYRGPWRFLPIVICPCVQSVERTTIYETKLADFSLSGTLAGRKRGLSRTCSGLYAPRHKSTKATLGFIEKKPIYMCDKAQLTRNITCIIRYANTGCLRLRGIPVKMLLQIVTE